MVNPSYKLHLPPKMVKRGRPKGQETTVVGLLREKKSTRPAPFLKKTPVEKEKGKLVVSSFPVVD
jgi:hypothetical protein